MGFEKNRPDGIFGTSGFVGTPILRERQKFLTMPGTMCVSIGMPPSWFETLEYSISTENVIQIL